MTRVSRATRKQEELESPYISIAKCKWKIGQKVRCKGSIKMIGKVVAIYKPSYHYNNQIIVYIEWYNKGLGGTMSYCFHPHQIVKA